MRRPGRHGLKVPVVQAVAPRSQPAAPSLRSAILATLVLTLCVLAGCAQDTDAMREERVNAAAAPFLVADHGVENGHFIASLHNGSYGIERVGYSNGVDTSGDADHILPGVHYSEIAMVGHLVLLNRIDPKGVHGGFVVIDIQDPAHPVTVGAFDGASGYDIETNPEGTLAFSASQRNDPQVAVGGILGGGSVQGAQGRGTVAVDISDPARPRELSWTPFPYNGPHTLTFVRHPTRGDFLVASTYDLVSSTAPGQPGALPVTQRVLVYQVHDDQLPTGRTVTLTTVSTFQLNDVAPNGQMYFPHDTRVQVHPETGQVLLYVAYWDLGVRILDFTDPTNLVEISHWTDFSPSKLNNIHLVQPVSGLIAGKHITIAEPEIIQAAGETGQITILDTTDPAQPKKLGHWTLPEGKFGQLDVQGLDFSPHNFDVWDGKIALAHNHAGVWVIDIHDQTHLDHPRSLGFYFPNVPRGQAPAMEPRVWGVLVRPDARDGHSPLLYVSDESSGLHILRYTGE